MLISPQGIPEPLSDGRMRYRFRDGSIQEDYRYDFNLEVFTSTLINAGYRRYQLVRADRGEDEVVWARPVETVVAWKKERVYGHLVETEPVIQVGPPDLSGYAAGVVHSLPMSLVSARDTIVLDGQDSGAINKGGERIMPLVNGRE